MGAETGSLPTISIGAYAEVLEVGEPFKVGDAICENSKGDSFRASIIKNTVDIWRLGQYEVVWSCFDSYGRQASETRTVHVVDTTPPVVSLLGPVTVVLEVGSFYEEDGASCTDISNVTLIPPRLDLEVNFFVVGSYDTVWGCEDVSGNMANRTRVINVVDTTPPNLSLIGSNSLVALVGMRFEDPGAICMDAAEGILESVVVTNTVNTSVEGVYEVTWFCSDRHGNEAWASRVVSMRVNGVEPKNFTSSHFAQQSHTGKLSAAHNDLFSEDGLLIAAAAGIVVASISTVAFIDAFLLGSKLRSSIVAKFDVLWKVTTYECQVDVVDFKDTEIEASIESCTPSAHWMNIGSCTPSTHCVDLQNMELKLETMSPPLTPPPCRSPSAPPANPPVLSGLPKSLEAPLNFGAVEAQLQESERRADVQSRVLEDQFLVDMKFVQQD